MIAFIKRLKFSYSVYNFFNKEKLKHNIPLYKKYGLNKRYYDPISSLDFLKVKNAENAETTEERVHRLETNPVFRQQKSEHRQALLDFEDKGFAILNNYIPDSKVDAINAEIDRLIDDKTVGFRYKNKIMFAIHHSDLILKTGEDKTLKTLLSLLLNRNVILFQSINFLSGSEQSTHSDSIHMTTFPLGGMIAIWIALEDIGSEQGPLHYYPGSHKLPYFLNSEYDNKGNQWLIGKQPYTEYEKMIEKKLASLDFKKELFFAKKGDMLIWHANLFHGGEPHNDKSLSRKSMVMHYFSEGVICYHEVTQRPALMPYTV